MPDCLLCWRASSGRDAIGPPTTGTRHGSRTRADRLAAAERLTRAARPRRQPGADRSRIPRRMPEGRVGRKRQEAPRAGPIYLLLVGVIAGLFGWINQSYIAEQWRWWWTDRPFVAANIWPYVLEPAAEHALKPKDIFRECSAATGERLLPADGRAPGRVVHHGIASNRAGPPAVGRAAASGHDCETFCRVAGLN